VVSLDEPLSEEGRTLPCLLASMSMTHSTPALDRGHLQKPQSLLSNPPNRPTHAEVGWRMGVRMDARALALGRKPSEPEAYKGKRGT
jgi:hypothetical protein